MGRPYREVRNKLRVFVPPTPISFKAYNPDDLPYVFLFPAGGRLYDLQILREVNIKDMTISLTLSGKGGAVHEDVIVKGGYSYLNFKGEVHRGDVFQVALVEGDLRTTGAFMASFLYELNPRSRNIKYLDLDREKKNEGVPVKNTGLIEAGS